MSQRRILGDDEDVITVVLHGQVMTIRVYEWELRNEWHHMDGIGHFRGAYGPQRRSVTLRGEVIDSNDDTRTVQRVKKAVTQAFTPDLGARRIKLED